MPTIRTVPSSDHNCTYGGTFSIYCKEFSNSFLKLQIKHFHMKTKSDMFIKLRTICFSTVCYTVKHVLSEMIEIVPPYHIWYLRFLTHEYVSGVLIFLMAYFPPHFSPAGVFWRYEHIRSGLDIVRCPVIATISFSTAHQSRFSISPFLSEDGAICSPKSWFCSAWGDGLCPNYKHIWCRRSFPRRQKADGA